ncbi:MAG: hypothetical protein WB678_15415 [Stellaceae bacterium]
MGRVVFRTKRETEAVLPIGAPRIRSLDLPHQAGHLFQIECSGRATNVIEQASAMGSRSRPEDDMWKRQKEYRLAELLDHPALSLALASQGMERRSVALLLEAEGAARDREIDRVEEPIFA